MPVLRKLQAVGLVVAILSTTACTWRNAGYSSSSAYDYNRSPRYLGRLSNNPYDPESVSNPYAQDGSRYSATSVNNPYGPYGNPYSAKSITNPYTLGGPRLFAQDGTYLGRLNSNRYDPESVSNPYGRYGSRYNPDSINNPYGRFGSRYSSESPTNPYATKPPVIIDSD